MDVCWLLLPTAIQKLILRNQDSHEKLAIARRNSCMQKSRALSSVQGTVEKPLTNSESFESIEEESLDEQPRAEFVN